MPESGLHSILTMIGHRHNTRLRKEHLRLKILRLRILRLGGNYGVDAVRWGHLKYTYVPDARIYGNDVPLANPDFVDAVAKVKSRFERALPGLVSD